MPFRRLPDTDATRTTALNALFTKSQGVADADLPYPVALRAQINALQPQWTSEVAQVSAALGAQTSQTSVVTPLAAAFDLVFDHFVQVLHLAVRRGVFERADRTYYGLGMEQSDVPPVYSHADRVLWAGRIAAGETQRVADKPSQPAMSMPSAAQVASAFAAYMAAHAVQSDAKEAYDDEQADVAGLRPTVDALILEAWDQMEFKYRRETGPSRRRKCREWGVVYIPRAGEEPDPDDGSGGGGVAAPTGVTATQDGDGAAVVMDADADAAAEEWQALEQPEGSTDEPVLVGSSASLPITMTRSPGAFIYTMKKKVGGVLSPPSAPVPLTVL